MSQGIWTVFCKSNEHFGSQVSGLEKCELCYINCVIRTPGQKMSKHVKVVCMWYEDTVYSMWVEIFLIPSFVIDRGGHAGDGLRKGSAHVPLGSSFNSAGKLNLQSHRVCLTSVSSLLDTKRLWASLGSKGTFLWFENPLNNLNDAGRLELGVVVGTVELEGGERG